MTEHEQNSENKNLIVKFDGGTVEVENGKITKITDRDNPILAVKKKQQSAMAMSQGAEGELVYFHQHDKIPSSGTVTCDLESERRYPLQGEVAKETILSNVAVFFDQHPDVKEALKDMQLPEFLGSTVIADMPVGTTVNANHWNHKLLIYGLLGNKF